MANRTGYVCDSTADFPPGMVNDLGLHILPVHIMRDDTDHRRGVSIDNREVIRRLKQKRDVQTKPFYPVECVDFFERLLARCDIWLACADNLAEVMITREKLAAALDRSVDAIKLVEIGASIAVHTGPGSVRIAMTPSAG